MERGLGTRRWLPLRLGVVAAVVLVAVLVAILARQPTDEVVLTSYRGVPAGVEEEISLLGGNEPGWVLGEDGRLAVYAAGSSACPPTPVAVTADGNRVTVRLEVVGGPECTADFGYTTHVVALPVGVDPQALEVELDLADPG